jgi:Tol biopolymer transport system component
MQTRVAWALVPALLAACTRPADDPTTSAGPANQAPTSGNAAAPRSSSPRTGADAAAAAERIVYSSLRPGNWDIYYFASAGAPARRLTDHPGLDYDAVFSPDGRWVVFTSERRGNPDLYAIDLESAPGSATPTAHLLIDSDAMEDQAAFAPDGRTLAFVSTASGNADVYAIPFSPEATQALGAARNLTSHPGGDFRPDFSPDGERIAFTSDRDTPVYGHPIFSFTRQREGEIYVMSRDGADARRLTTSVDWDGSPEWSSDGRTIYFYSGRPRELPGPPQSPILGQEGGFRIWAMGSDGSSPRAVTPPGVEALAPAVMPGGRVAYQTRSGFADWSIASVEETGAAAPRAETQGASYWLPDYDKNGAMVCHGVGPTIAETQAVEEILGAGALLAADYPAAAALPDRTVALYPMRHTSGLAPRPDSDETAVTIENEAGSRLVLADFDGGNQRELFSVAGVGIVSGTPNRIFDIKWSPDGSWLTYTQGFFAGQGTDEADVWVMRADGTERQNLTADVMGNEGVAAFSPDSSRLVFRSSRAGNVDLFVMDREGGRVMQLTNDTARENFPVFSPSGDAIAFSSNRDGVVDRFGNRTFDNYVMVLEPDGSAGDVRRISTDPGQDSHPWYSPDGRWIAFTSERGGLSDEEPMVQEVVFGPQMYGEIYAYRLEDGLTVRLTHNKWEEGNPFWVRAPR